MHSHCHEHGNVHDHSSGVSDSRLLWTVLLNQLLTVAQVVAGFISGSFALLSDAAHNFSDANSLLIAYVARRISRREADEKFTFGYRRAETIGALINLTLLAAVALALVVEAIRRFAEPTEIDGWLMGAAAGVALIVDAVTAMMLWSMSRGSTNVRAAFLHNLVDALASLAVLIGAIAIVWLDWNWVDPLLTLLIAGYILWQVWAMFPSVVNVLMQSAPVGLDLNRLVEQVESVDGVSSIHHLHVWEMDEQHRALEAHVVIDAALADQLDVIKSRVKKVLSVEFEIGHSTLEFELDCDDNSGCTDRAMFSPH